MPLKFDANMHQTWDEFNWTGVVLALVILTALVYWYLPAPMGAKHFFKGPKRADEDEISDPHNLDHERIEARV